MSKETTKAGAKAPAELTLEQATARIVELEAECAAGKKVADGLVGTKESQAGRIQELEAEISKLMKAGEGSAKELEDAAQVVEDLKDQLKNAGEGKVIGPTVKIGKEKYKVLGGMLIAKKPYSAADIAADKELAEKLLKKGSKLLKQID